MKLLNPIPLYKDYPKFQWPYWISQYFGENPAIYAQFGYLGHNGIDIAAPKGTPVVAIHDGWIVEATAKDTGYGLRIVQYFETDGFGWDIIYGHFDSIVYPNIPYNILNKNHPVKRGEVIGKVDSTGFSTGHHLHVTLRQWSNFQLLNQQNGYGGAVDIFAYIHKDIMLEFVRINGGNEYAIMETTPVGYHISRAVDEVHLQKIAMGASFPLPKNPDGSVNFSLAKNITL